MNWLHWVHSYVPVSVQHGRWRVAGGDATVVLEQCWCGRTRTRDLAGHWTAEEIGVRQNEQDRRL